MSVTFTLSAAPVFPEGLTVGAYPRSTFPGSPPVEGQSARGTVKTAVVSGGVAAFSGLAAETMYFAGASVSGTWRWITFVTAAETAGSSSLPAGVISIQSFNGVTDGSNINAALTLLNGPGEVRLPAGTAGIDTSVLLDTGQALDGTGDGTILKALVALATAENAALEYEEKAATGPKGPVVVNKSKNSHGARVSNLKIDGNGGTNTAGKGIGWIMNGTTLSTKEAANGITVENVWIYNCKEAGYESENGTNGVVNVLENVQSYWNKGNGFTIESSDGMYSNCYAEKNGLAGWQLGAKAGFSHVANCGGSDSGQVTPSAGYGFKLTSGRIKLVGCYAQDNSLHGFFLSGGAVVDTVLSGCEADSNGWLNSAAKAAGFYLDSTTARTILVGCKSVERCTWGGVGGTEELGEKAGKGKEKGFQFYGYFLAANTAENYIAATWHNNETGVGVELQNESNATTNVILTTNGGYVGNVPGGVGASNIDRGQATVLTVPMPELSGKLELFRVPVTPGQVISTINFRSGSTEGKTLTESWAALYSTAWKKLGVTGENVEAAWLVETNRAYTLASKYTVPAGVTAVYAGICIVGGTMPTMTGMVELKSWMKELEPFVGMHGSASLTNAASAPAETLHVAPHGKIPFVWFT